MLDHDDASLSGTAQRLPRILIAGEFSAGKSQLINALAGQKVMVAWVSWSSSMVQFVTLE